MVAMEVEWRVHAPAALPINGRERLPPPEADIASRAAFSQRLKAFAASSRADVPRNEAVIGSADDAAAATAAIER